MLSFDIPVRGDYRWGGKDLPHLPTTDEEVAILWGNGPMAVLYQIYRMQDPAMPVIDLMLKVLTDAIEIKERGTQDEQS